MTTAPNTPLANQQKLPADVKSIIDSVLASSGTESKNPKSGTDVSTSKIKLTKNTALAIMELAAENAGYTTKFTSADVEQFMKEFDAEQAKQVEKVVTSTATKTTPGGTTPGAVDKTMSSTAKTEFPSFFKPADFAVDWVWKKVDFQDDKSLGAKSLGVLAEVRGLVDKFQLIGISDREIRNVAKLIAMGDKTLDEYTIDLQGKAVGEFPQFADRFKTDPKLTTYDIALPVINMVAETLGVDPKTINPKTHPVVLAYTRSAGADGKGQAPSYYDLLLKTKQLPEYQMSAQANNEARDGATSLLRSLGVGI